MSSRWDERKSGSFVRGTPDQRGLCVAAATVVGVLQTIADQFGPIRGGLQPGTAVTVTGVAFFDRFHDQEGVAPNVIELHPLPQ